MLLAKMDKLSNVSIIQVLYVPIYKGAVLLFLDPIFTSQSLYFNAFSSFVKSKTIFAAYDAYDRMTSLRLLQLSVSNTVICIAGMLMSQCQTDLVMSCCAMANIRKMSTARFT